MNCPQCKDARVGKLAADRFFCPDCCVEFASSPSGTVVFQVLENGELDQLAIPDQSTMSGEDMT